MSESKRSRPIEVNVVDSVHDAQERPTKKIHVRPIKKEPIKLTKEEPINYFECSSGNSVIDKFLQERQGTGYHEFCAWIDPVRLVKIKHLADGGFGSVYVATWLDRDGFEFGERDTPGKVALKTFLGADGGIAALLKEFSNHWRVLRRFNFWDDRVRVAARTQETVA